MFHYSEMAWRQIFHFAFKIIRRGWRKDCAVELSIQKFSVVVLVVVLHEPFFTCIKNCANRHFILHHLFLHLSSSNLPGSKAPGKLIHNKANMKTPYLAILRSLATIPPPAHLNTASLLSIHECTQSSISGVKKLSRNLFRTC